MPLDLSNIALLDESFMQDACLIERDPQRHADDTWDDATGTYTQPAGDMATVYSGVCYFWSESGPSDREEGDAEIKVSANMCSIPRGSPAVRPGDRITCTASQEDPQLPGQEFRVNDFIVGTFETSRRIFISKWTPDPTTIGPEA